MTPDVAVAVVQRAAQAGAAFFDVAYYNMGPHSDDAVTDKLFGQAVRAAGLGRDDYLLCGKLWLWDYPAQGFRDQMDVALDRIGTDHADAVVVGDYEPGIDLRQVVLDVQSEIERGRFGFWGINNWPAADVALVLDFAEAEGLTPPSFAQLKYSLVRRTMAEGPYYRPWFDDGTLALQASDVFEGGILVGKVNPARGIGADVGGIRDQIRAAWPTVAALAESLDATPAQLGLAFTLTHPACANVLFGATSVAQLEDNLGALALLDRVGRDRLRDLTEDLWLDHAVRADGVW
jgi:aryl-alcohol dehydrogenase-like predicted oxidoreductase